MNEELVRETLKVVMDPELGANIVELGLVDEIRFGDQSIRVRIGTTSPSCPMGQYLSDTAKHVLRERFPALSHIEVSLAWNPLWSPEHLSPVLRERFGWA